MKKPTNSHESLTKKPAGGVVEAPPERPTAKPARLTDLRINTTLRIEPEKLERLKIIAARKRVRVNDLLLEGVDHVLALHSANRAA